MQYKSFGKKQTEISRLGLGTVSLGVPYGINLPNEKDQPDRIESVELVLQAIERGINFIDTAPNYGSSESIVGQALARISKPVFVATKVTLPPAFTEPRIAKEQIKDSIQKSLDKLNIDSIFLLQIHNATKQGFNRPWLEELLQEILELGWVQQWGASVYEVNDAKHIFENSYFHIVQAPLNILDRRFGHKLQELASSKKKSLIYRSALLKGLLTPRWEHFPESMRKARKLINDLTQFLKNNDLEIIQTALRFAFKQANHEPIILGIKNSTELNAAIDAESAPAISPDLLSKLTQFESDDLEIIDPRQWSEVN